MKLGPVTKLDKRNTATSKKVDDDFMSAICDVIVIFLFYVQFVAIRKPILGTWSVKLTFSLVVNFYLTKTENRTEQSLTQPLSYCF